MIKNKAPNDKQVAMWLLVCCVAVGLMVLLGGLTRLTDSGLSIVKWEPLSGAVPPMSEGEWGRYFEAYKLIPQYAETNKGMTLEGFKGIFWLEYFHRLVGRVAGFIFLLPLIYFAAKKRITKSAARKFGAIFVLGAVQGVVGWYMVASGFAGRTSVSQYMLAMHLGTAFVIFALIYRARLDYVGNSAAPVAGLRGLARFMVGLVFFMIMLGALVAGTHAGFAYNTFPLMDGHLVPGGIYIMKPWWVNHFENIATIQFQHRLFAVVTTVVAFWLAARLRRSEPRLALALVGFVLLQVGLGISTLYGFGVYADYQPASHAYLKVLYMPVIVAALHQLNALLLFAVALKIHHRVSGRGVNILV